MRCRDAQRILVTEGAVEYGGSSDPRVRRHLLDCMTCREEAGRLALEARVIRMAFERLPVDEAFTRGVIERISSGKMEV